LIELGEFPGRRAEREAAEFGIVDRRVQKAGIPREDRAACPAGLSMCPVLVNRSGPSAMLSSMITARTRRRPAEARRDPRLAFSKTASACR